MCTMVQVTIVELQSAVTHTPIANVNVICVTEKKSGIERAKTILVSIFGLK